MVEQSALISLTSVLGVLAVVIVGTLVVVQVVRMEAIGEWFVRALRVIVLGFLGMLLVRCAVLPILICALVRLRESLFWFVVGGLVLVATAFVVWMTRRPLDKHRPTEE